MQKVHFSMTPRARTVTSGLSWRWSGSGHAISLYLYQLKYRTL